MEVSRLGDFMVSSGRNGMGHAVNLITSSCFDVLVDHNKPLLLCEMLEMVWAFES